uniref:Uncharacterized protein n=1 Tax=Cacopsylla melanoneura TaxID=428564 RepID=A0A8D9BFU5_9HEMI
MNSTLKFVDRAKSSVSYKNNSFKCTSNQPNSDNILYECVHNNCGANIVLDKKKNKIMSSNLEHMNHSPIPPMKLKLRSNNILHQNNIIDSTKSQNRVASPVPTSKAKIRTNSSRTVKNTQTSVKINKIKKSNVKQTLQSHDASQPSLLPDEVLSSHVDNQALDTNIPTDNITSSNHTDIAGAQSLESISTRDCTQVQKSECSDIQPREMTYTSIQTREMKSSDTQTDNNDREEWEYIRTKLESIIDYKNSEIDSLLNKIELLENNIQSIVQNALTVPIARVEPKIKPQSVPQPKAKIDGKITCHIIGDSHVRGLRDKMSPLLPDDYKVQTFFQPGAGFHEVANTQVNSPSLITPSAIDPVIVLCGTNDVCATPWEIVQNALDKLFAKFYKY